MNCSVVNESRAEPGVLKAKRRAGKQFVRNKGGVGARSGVNAEPCARGGTPPAERLLWRNGADEVFVSRRLESAYGRADDSCFRFTLHELNQRESTSDHQNLSLKADDLAPKIACVCCDAAMSLINTEIRL